MGRSTGPRNSARRVMEKGRISADSDIVERIADALYASTLPHRLDSAEAMLESLRNAGLDIVRHVLPAAAAAAPRAQHTAASGSFADLMLDVKSLTVTCNRRALKLTLLQFRLLSYLIAHSGHAGTVVPPSDLLRAGWKRSAGGENPLKTHLSTIRAELRRVRSHVTIDSVRGVGYRLAVRAAR